MADQPVEVILISDNADEPRRLADLLNSAEPGHFHCTPIAPLESLAETALDAHGVALASFSPLPSLEQTQSLRRVAVALPLVVLAEADDPGVSPLLRQLNLPAVLPRQDGRWLPHALRWAMERRRLEERLDHAQGMQALGHLSRGLAHEFNNQLTGIIGYVDLLQQGPATADILEMCLPEITRASQRLAFLTQELRLFGRRQAQPRLFDLNEVVRDLAPTLTRRLKPAIELRLELAEDPCRLRCDPSSLETIVRQLVLNSQEAIDDQGHILLRTEIHQLEAEHMDPDFPGASGSYVVLQVSDSGHGMEQAVQQEIFTPYFTTKEPGSGVGLGLTLVQSIVRQLSGHLRVTSRPGAGTTVMLYLPAPTGLR